MKTVALLILFTVAFFACQNSGANPTPAVGKMYPNTQVDSLLQAYRMAHSVDVMPTEAHMRNMTAAFPGAYDIDWEVAANVYQVDFEINRVDYEAWYDKDGNLLAYKFDVKNSALPAVVKNAVNLKYPKYRIDDVDRFFCGSISGYTVSVEKGESEYKTCFKDDGSILRETMD